MPALAHAASRPPVRTGTLQPEQLKPKHRLMVAYMVYGLDHETLRSRLPMRYVPAGVDGDGLPLQKMARPECGEPLTLADAATVLRIRLRQARSLAAQPVFQRLLAAETQAFRDGARARAVRRMVALIDEPGLGKAADRKVQLTAAMATMGEVGSQGSSVTVNVGNTQISAGVVIERWSDRDDERDARTIEHEA